MNKQNNPDIVQKIIIYILHPT